MRPEGSPGPRTAAGVPQAWPWARQDLSPLVEVALVFLASRILVYFFVWWSRFFITPNTVVFLPETQTGLPWWLDWSTHWDGIWYFSIVRDGYQLPEPGMGSNLAFWPLFPALLKVLTFLFGQAHLALLAAVLSNGCFFFALWAFRYLVALDASPNVARRTLFYVAFFPTSFFYSAAYPESLFLLGLALAWYFVRKGRLFFAGSFGAAATLAHVPGVLVFFPLLLERLRRAPGGEGSGLSWRLAWLLLAPGALLGFLAYQGLVVGDAFGFLRAAQGWRHTLAWPWTDIIAVWGWVLPGGKEDPREAIPLLATLGALAVTAASMRTLRASYLLWVMSVLLLYLSLPSPQPLISMGRYVLHLFPLFITLARWGEHPWVNRGLLAFFLPGLGICTGLFTNWHWVG